MACSGPFAPPSGGAGWYDDPAGSGTMRYWDGSRWTDALSSAVPPAGPHSARDDARAWALAAHLSALLSLVVGLVFVGPLLVYLAQRDDPFVRHHAAEALNFNLSVLLYAIPLAIGLAMLGIVLIVVPLALAWLVLVCVGAVKAGEGAAFRYPLTIRLLR